MPYVSRRSFLSAAAASMVLSAAARTDASASAIPSNASRGTRKPNIILVMADDLGLGDIVPYGQTRFETPTLASLARSGALFETAYSGAPVCAPARTALLTGRHAGATRHFSNAQRALRADDLAMSRELGKAGYRTAFIGKWALGGAESTGRPDLQGFDFWFGFLDQGDAHRHYPERMLKNGSVVTYESNAGNSGERYANDLFVDEADQFIRSSKQPFFLYLPLTLPHADIVAPERVLSQFRGRFPETPFPGGHYARQEFPNAAYAAMVTLIDETVGRLVGLLDELGIARDTIFIFTSDNGPASAGGKDSSFFNSSAGLRGGKWSLYEGGIRVPLIIRWPAVVQPRQRITAPVYFPDLMPTLLATGMIPSAGPESGISLLPLLLNAAYTPPPRPLYWAFEGPGFIGGDPGVASNWTPSTFQEALRYDNWKAIRFKRERIELFNLESDPGETADIASQFPGIVSDMAAMMEREWASFERR